MSHQRGPGTKPTPMEQVVLGALSELELGPGPSDNTAKAVADALTRAQEYLLPRERIKTPVSGQTAGQYLGMLRARGLVRCEPEAGIMGRSRRRWFTIDTGLEQQ